MSKRKADVQLTDRNYQDDDDDDDEEPTTQPIASAAVMATRRIVKGRRTQPVQESAETQANVTSTPFNFASPSFYPAFSFATSTFATSETSSAPGWPAFSFATQKEKEEKKEESEEAEKKDKKAEKTPEKDNGEKKEEKEEKKEESKEGEKKEKKDEKAEKTPEKKADKKEEKKEENKEEKKEEAKLQKDEKAEKTSEKNRSNIQLWQLYNYPVLANIHHNIYFYDIYYIYKSISIFISTTVSFKRYFISWKSRCRCCGYYISGTIFVGNSDGIKVGTARRKEPN